MEYGKEWAQMFTMKIIVCTRSQFWINEMSDGLETQQEVDYY